ncbi:hypothetical protein [Terricaulis sp.]|uniref:hypothetical protein n=1 Tax=Terricaulis sp. TaxID=2768686 RepID=UPI0037833EAD
MTGERESERRTAQLALTYDVVDRQYSLYNWFTNKLQIMLAINGAAVAAVSFLMPQPAFSTPWAKVPLYLGLLLLVLSLCWLLYICIPTMDSKTAERPSPRSNVHITSMTLAQYRAIVADLDEKDIVWYNTQQIYGMAHNNKKTNADIRVSVVITLSAFCFLAIAVIIGLTQEFQSPLAHKILAKKPTAVAERTVPGPVGGRQ